eukprot:5292979-Amphidinium_carterae.1
MGLMSQLCKASIRRAVHSLSNHTVSCTSRLVAIKSRFLVLQFHAHSEGDPCYLQPTPPTTARRNIVNISPVSSLCEI